MAVKRLYNDRHYFPDSAGNNALSGGKLFVYLTGSPTKATTYNSSTGAVANSNPLVLDAAGRLQSEVWGTTGITLKLVLTTSTDTDPPGSPIWTEDAVSVINDVSSASASEWVASGFTPTYVSANSFTVPGDQTATLQVGRRLQIVDAGGTKYATITASVFGAVTTVTVLVDSSGSLANPVSTVAYGLVSSINTSIPFFILQNLYPASSTPNAFFQVDQLANSATSVADDVYGHDHWFALTQTASIQISTQTLQENGQTTNARLNQNQAAAQRMGYACIIESSEAQKLRGQTMTFKPRLRISNSQAVRIAVIEWTGTADAVTSDIVNDWTSSDYSDGAARFFVDANQAPLGNSVVTPTAATWTDATSLPVAIGSSCTNLILFVWTEQTAAQNVTLDIGKVRFVPGTFASELLIPTFAETLLYAQRFYEKSFLYATAPAQSAGIGTGEQIWVTQRAAATINNTTNIPMVVKRASPTITLYNPGAANAQVRNSSGINDCSASGGVLISPRSFIITTTGNPAGAIGDNLNVHWAASARL